MTGNTDVKMTELISGAGNMIKASGLASDIKQMVIEVRNGLDMEVKNRDNIDHILEFLEKEFGEVAANLEQLRNKIVFYEQSVVQIDTGIDAGLEGVDAQSYEPSNKTLEKIMAQYEAVKRNSLLRAWGIIQGGLLIKKYNSDEYDDAINSEINSIEVGYSSKVNYYIMKGRLKQFSGYNGIAYNNNDYSDFGIVNRFEGEIFKQGVYEEFLQPKDPNNPNNGEKKNRGCTCCSVAMIYNMAHPDNKKGPYDFRLNPDKAYQTGGCTVQRGDAIDQKRYGKSDNGQEHLNKCAKAVLEGNAVEVRVGDSFYGDGTHSMVAIGLRKGVDLNNVKMSDILCIDPYYGKVMTMAEYGKKHICNWALGVAS